MKRRKTRALNTIAAAENSISNGQDTTVVEEAVAAGIGIGIGIGTANTAVAAANTAGADNTAGDNTAADNAAADNAAASSAAPTQTRTTTRQATCDAMDEGFSLRVDDDEEEEELEVAYILNREVDAEDKSVWYECVWVGYGEDETTWESHDNLIQNAGAVVLEFNKKVASKKRKRDDSTMTMCGEQVKCDSILCTQPNWLSVGNEWLGRRVMCSDGDWAGDITGYAFSSKRGRTSEAVLWRVEEVNGKRQVGMNKDDIKAGVVLHQRIQREQNRAKRHKQH